MNSWDRFEAGASLDVASLGYEDNVDVFLPSESYTAGDGVDLTYTGPVNTISAIVTTPEETSDTDRGGRRSETDLVVLVSDDVPPPQINAGDGRARFEVDSLPGRYEARTRERTQDGLIRYDCVEV